MKSPHKPNYRWSCYLLLKELGDTPRVAVGFLKQNFKVKFESRNIKVIAWQHSQKISEKQSGF